MSESGGHDTSWYSYHNHKNGKLTGLDTRGWRLGTRRCRWKDTKSQLCGTRNFRVQRYRMTEWWQQLITLYCIHDDWFCMCVCAWVCMCMLAHVRTGGGQKLISSDFSMALRQIFWDKVSHCPWSWLILLSWVAKGPQLSGPGITGYLMRSPEICTCRRFPPSEPSAQPESWSQVWQVFVCLFCMLLFRSVIFEAGMLKDLFPKVALLRANGEIRRWGLVEH